MIIITKKDKEFWKKYKGGVLPKEFDLSKIRTDSRKRYKKFFKL